MPTALVLSAGGLFGAWQAGAWRALAPVFRPDLVVGASAGAINGWAIAGGLSPDELAARWLDPRMGSIMTRRRVPWLPWKGIFAPQALEELVRELFDRVKPRIPFAATLAEVPRLRPRLVRGEEMTWRHLMASCAIPLGYPPVRLEGRWCVDGGLLAALPLWAAAELGASRALALNALPLMPSRTVRAGVALARATMRRFEPREVPKVVHLQPGETLGSLHDAITWKESYIRRWIELGERDARRLLATSGVSDLAAVFD